MFLPIKILKTATLTAAAASYQFTGVNTLAAAWDALSGVTSRHIVLIVHAYCTAAADSQYLLIGKNGIATATYSVMGIQGVDNLASTLWDGPRIRAEGFFIPGANFANAMGGGIAVFPDAFVDRAAAWRSNWWSIGGAAEVQSMAAVSEQNSVRPVTSLELYPGGGNFGAGSTFSIGVIDERYLIRELVLLGAVAFDFNRIPQFNGDLAIILNGRTNSGATWDNVFIRFNGDSVAANYWSQYLRGTQAAITAARANDNLALMAVGSGGQGNRAGGGVLSISRYRDSYIPHWSSWGFMYEAAGANPYGGIISGRWTKTDPIRRIQLVPGGATFQADSMASLYAIPKRLIGRQQLTGNAATITFDGIPQDFEYLQLHVYARTDKAAVDDEVNVTINDDAVAANYDTQILSGAVAVVSAVRNAASQQVLIVPGANEGAGEYGGGSIIMPGYNRTNYHKHLVSLSGQQENRVTLSSGRWENAGAITKIVLSPVGGANFVTGSVFELEGVLPRDGLPSERGMSIGV